MIRRLASVLIAPVAIAVLGVACGARVGLPASTGSSGSGPNPSGGAGASGPSCACTTECKLSEVRAGFFAAKGSAEIEGVAYAGDGSYYVTGLTGGTVDFGGGELPNPGANSTFVAAFSANGAHRWSRMLGNADYDGGRSIAVGPQGPVLSGFMNGTANLGGAPVSGGAFLVALDMEGKHRWSRGFGAPLGGAAEVAVDSADNVYVTGHGQGPFNGLAQGKYLAKLDASGKTAWVVQAAGNDFGGGVALSGDDAYFLYAYEGATQIGGKTFSVQGGERGAIVARVDASGQVAWAVQAAKSDYDLIPEGIGAGASGVVITGVLGGNVDLGSGPKKAQGSFLVKLGVDGAHAWDHVFQDGNGWGAAVSIDDRGVTTLVTAMSSVDFGGGVISAAGNGMGMARFDGCGAHLWSKAVGTGFGSPVRVGAMALGPNGALVVGGGTAGAIDFGGGAKMAPGGQAPFVSVLARSE